jgi:hypothetical protein
MPSSGAFSWKAFFFRLVLVLWKGFNLTQILYFQNFFLCFQMEFKISNRRDPFVRSNCRGFLHGWVWSLWIFEQSVAQNANWFIRKAVNWRKWSLSEIYAKIGIERKVRFACRIGGIDSSEVFNQHFTVVLQT